MSCNPCNCGDCDQSRSNNTFYTKQLHQRAAKVLNLDGDNTSWFEIIDVMEKKLAEKLEPSLLEAKYQRLLNGVESDLAEIERIQGVYDEQYRKGRKVRMERDKALNDLDQLKMLARAVVKERLEYALVHPCDEFNDDVKIRQLSPNLQALYEALK